jgi:hypothetical protein
MPQAAKLAKGLNHPPEWRSFKRCARAGRRVSDLAELDIPRGTVRDHVRQLHQLGFLTADSAAIDKAAVERVYLRDAGAVDETQDAIWRRS